MECPLALMITIDNIFKYLYLPACRAYAKYVLGDKRADAIMYWLFVPYFLCIHRYWPNFKNPKSFSEKIWHRKLYNRDPLLTLVSDKLLVRDYIAKHNGVNYLIPLLWQGDNPADIPFDNLPEKFVIKANHGCGYNIIVQDKMKLDKEKTKQRLSAWLNENFCQDTGTGIAWAYKNIKPAIIVEAFIGENGQIPIDYKFFCYAGCAEFVQVSFGRFGDASERLCDRNFKPLDAWNGLKLYDDEIKQPDNYEEMLKLADVLSQGFDFIRVDLYSVGKRIYFGELTCYHAGGRARFIPKEYDFIFGEKWVINNQPVDG